MKICNISEFSKEFFEEMFGEEDWREFNYTYMKIMDDIGDPCFKYLVDEQIIIPFYEFCTEEKNSKPNTYE